MPNVAELIGADVTLTLDCVDRLHCNAYVPRLQSEGRSRALPASEAADPCAGLVRTHHGGFQAVPPGLIPHLAHPLNRVQKGERKNTWSGDTGSPPGSVVAGMRGRGPGERQSLDRDEGSPRAASPLQLLLAVGLFESLLPLRDGTPRAG